MDIPDPGAEMPPGFEGIETLVSWVKWIAFIAAGVGVLIAAMKFGIGMRRGEGVQDAIAEVGWPLFGAIMASAGIGLVTTLVGA
jgi:hypothetical protein